MIPYENKRDNETAMLLHDMEPFQRPREKCLANGPRSLEVEELLAILLRTGYHGVSAVAVAGHIIESLEDGVYGLNTVSMEELCRVKGVGPDKAVTIAAAVELGRRLRELQVKKEFKDFSNPEAIASYVMERVRHFREERFYVALLTIKNTLIRLEPISVGGISSSMAEQRAVFRPAIVANAASVILIHNHPSGDPTPSQADRRVTEVLRKAGDLMGIPVLDHIVIGDGTYVSFREKQLW